MVIVSREQGWQAASSSSPSSLRKLQVPIFYPCPPKGAMFMVQLVGTTFNSVFLNFPFVLLIFYLPFSPISSFPPLCLVSFLIYLLSFHMPFLLPPASGDHPCSPPILLKLQVPSFLFLSCKCYFYVTACRYNFFFFIIFLFLNISFSPIVFGPGSPG